jgi:hypothetical protein
MRLDFDDTLKASFINKIKAKNGNQQEIEKVIIQYLAQSNPQLQITTETEVTANYL